MRVLVTGGTGLIGSALVRTLLEDSHDVVVLTRSPERTQASLPSSVDLQKWDGASTEGWGELVSDVDAIVNLAGEGIADGRWTAARQGADQGEPNQRGQGAGCCHQRDGDKAESVDPGLGGRVLRASQ